MDNENQMLFEMFYGMAPGDSTCSDCNQIVCACESLADWNRERDQEPTSFSQWLEQNGDTI